MIYACRLSMHQVCVLFVSRKKKGTATARLGLEKFFYNIDMRARHWGDKEMNGSSLKEDVSSTPAKHNINSYFNFARSTHQRAPSFQGKGEHTKYCI